jgi:hypothetical protein
MKPISVRELLAIEVAVEDVVDLGHGRRVVPFAGGTFTGREGLEGTVVPGGADWQRTRPDGVLEIDARYALTTPDRDTIEVRSTGLRKASRAVLERMAAGEAVSGEEYYFRTHIRLTTTSPRLAWLNDLVAISTGQRNSDVVHIDVHEVL